MNEVYAALLLYSSKQPINEENLKRVLEAAGSEVDENKLKALVASLQNVDIEEVLKQAVTTAAPVEAKEEKKEEKVEEEEKKRAEEAVAGLGALFG